MLENEVHVIDPGTLMHNDFIVAVMCFGCANLNMHCDRVVWGVYKLYEWCS